MCAGCVAIKSFLPKQEKRSRDASTSRHIEQQRRIREKSEKDKSLTKLEEENRQVDSFAGYSDDVEGTHDDVPVGVIKGTLVKFSNDFRYVTRDGTELPPNLELVAVDVVRLVQKWKITNGSKPSY
jgi:hypothetical protein